MMKTTAKPGWASSGQKAPLASRLPSSTAQPSSLLRHALLPRSLDVTFSLYYRR